MGSGGPRYVGTLVVLAVAGTLVATGCGAVTDDGASTQEAMVELTMSTDQSEYRPDEPVEVDVALVNTGDAPVTVNGRFLVNHDHAPDEVRDLSFRFDAPEGYVNTNSFRVNAGEPTEADLVTLEPGGTHSKRIDLTRFFSLHQPGTYGITAVYLNIVEVPGHDVWTGELVSPTLTVRRR